VRSVLLRSVVIGGAALWAACQPTYPNCKSDENCKDHHEVCVEGQCQECAVDANCKGGFVCQSHRCAPKPECAKAADCGPGKGCEAGKCVAHECETDSACGKSGHCTDFHCVTSADAPAPAPSCDWSAVHFGFNEANLPPQSLGQLRELADCLKKAQGHVRLEGHADERGTEEYNLQLSNRRAASVRKYLHDLGVPAAGLSTVGYGKNRPVAEGHDEQAWAANRRVEFNRQ